MADGYWFKWDDTNKKWLISINGGSTWADNLENPLVGTIRGNSGAMTLDGDVTIPADHYLSIAGVSDSNGNIRFTAGNPYIKASGFINFPGGINVGGGTLYATNEIQARGGIDDDTHTYLLIGGGTGGGTHACFTASTPENTVPTVFLFAYPRMAEFYASGYSTYYQWGNTYQQTAGFTLADSNRRIGVNQAGYYRLSVSGLVTLGGTTTGELILTRYNDSDVAQKAYRQRVRNPEAGSVGRTAEISVSTYCAAGDYWVVSWSAGTPDTANDYFNWFCIERLN